MVNLLARNYVRWNWYTGDREYMAIGDGNKHAIVSYSSSVLVFPIDFMLSLFSLPVC